MTPEIILGPPGTGKTTSLLEIVDQELTAGTPPDRIAFLSFTRKAADEAITRACDKFKLTRNQFPFFRTIHSLAFKQLGLRRAEVFEGKRLREFAAWAKIKVTGDWSEDGLFLGMELGDKILFLENLSRVKSLPLQTLYKSFGENIAWSEVERVTRALKIFKSAQNLVDFTDMLHLFVEQGRCPKIEVLICDETQDQSPLQWQVIDKLATQVRRHVLAFDDDQMVYAWAGASDRVLTQKGFVKILGQSYRVPRLIQTKAFSIINRVKNRRPKEWSPRPVEGVINTYQNLADVDLSGKDILILVRNTYLINEVVEPYLRKQGIIYERNGVLSIRPSILNAIMDWEKLRQGEYITLADARNVYQYLSSTDRVKRGFKNFDGFEGEELVDHRALTERGGLLADKNMMWRSALNKLPLIDAQYIVAARRRGERTKKPRVRLSSIHTAKGSEGEHVVLFREMARKTWQEFEKYPDDEHRVFYVGITRAKQELSIVQSSNEREYPHL